MERAGNLLFYGMEHGKFKYNKGTLKECLTDPISLFPGEAS
ncbi:hypothetical protein SBA3_1160006 [Candidatus Sulfopaludibacter sp. SbA3]|nr:hypothetical protein SBA3_1160006 [Candidatus Sulfopaludibacter sp. SbA3]